MKNIIPIIIIIALTTSLFSSCIFDSSSDNIVGDYETIWIDIPQTRSISKGEEVVPEYVSAIGHNSRYIIAKQHPVTVGNIYNVSNDTTNYYIIEITSETFQDKPVYGPLNKHAFDSLREKFKIVDIQFDMLYPAYD
jgi:hypothetical protein